MNETAKNAWNSDHGPRSLLADAGRLCPEALDLLVVDGDGVLVDRLRLADSPSDMEEIAVEIVAAVPTLARTATAARLGAVQEWQLLGERGLLVIRRVPQIDMFLVLRVPSQVWVGKARFAARILAGQLAAALA